MSNLYWIWFALRMGAGSSGCVELLEHFGSPENIYAATARELEDFPGKRGKARYAPLLNKNLDEAYHIEQYCARYGISILKYSQAGYPKLLTNLKNPPIILYARGKIEDLNARVAIGVVGARELSEYGRKTAYKIGYELAAAGAVVVSGLALGIDSVAACGALDARGRTVAVLGSGLDYIYPPVHKPLAQNIATHGLILSEYPPLAKPSRRSFPLRNRIISGLCHGTLVVEARDGSGALITAKEAILQGRNVYAIPGNIDAKTAKGTNSLIKDGATAVTCAADILENYQYLYGKTLNISELNRATKHSNLQRGALAIRGVEEGDDIRTVKSGAEPSRGRLSQMLNQKGHIDGDTVKRVSGETEYPVYNDDKRPKTIDAPQAAVPTEGNIPDDLSPQVAAILSAMPVGCAVGVDYICCRGFEAAEVMTALTLFEVRGLVEAKPGNLYIRK